MSLWVLRERGREEKGIWGGGGGDCHGVGEEEREK